MFRSSFKWSLVIQVTNQITQFVVSIILARLLFPEDFGLIGMITVFISIGKIIMDGGLGQSLIRTKDLSDSDYSTVFIFSVLVALFLYLTLYVSSPLIASFFDEPILISVIRVYSLSIFIGSLSTIQSIKLNKSLQFKVQFKLLIPSILISSLVSIYMAYAGFGVWALVAKELVFSFIATVQLWFYSDWRPKLLFDKEKFKKHFGFSSNILMTELLSILFSNSLNVIIGKLFSSNQLGLYTRSKSFSVLPGGFIFNALNRVLYPLLSKNNSDDTYLKGVYRKVNSLFSFIIVPVNIFILLFSRQIILLLLSEKWIDATPYLQLLMVIALLDPFQKLLYNIFKVKGASKLIFKVSLIEYSLIIVAIASTFWIDVFSMLIAISIVSIVKYLITSRLIKNVLDYSMIEQIRDIYQPFIYSLIGGVVVYLTVIRNTYLLSNLEIIIFGFIVFTSSYIAQGALFRNSAQKMILRNVLSRVSRSGNVKK